MGRGMLLERRGLAVVAGCALFAVACQGPQGARETSRPVVREWRPEARPGLQPELLPDRAGDLSPEALDPWTGAWETTFGGLTLTPAGERVVGAYSGGRLVGTVVGARFEFTYIQPDERGEGWFELGEDGRSFVGKWRPGGDPVWRPWDGERGVLPAGFGGLWETSFGRMRLNVEGTLVRGAYEAVTGSLIEGTLDGQDGGRLGGRYAEPTDRGTLSFVLAEDSLSFSGTWRSEGDRVDRPWEGTRVLARPGALWLVILEAHWEESLREPQYAFGDMLASYLQMSAARHVGVRQRFFHDEADFRRFASEVAFLAEPVILVASTHGTPAGISVDGTTIGPQAIAESLQHASNLRLLHLSGCSMMNGPVPAAILEALGPAAHFPISGYSTDVAWDSSALADFTYLTFLLMRGLLPAEAVEQTHRAAPYTAETVPDGSGFAALGLRVLE